MPKQESECETRIVKTYTPKLLQFFPVETAEPLGPASLRLCKSDKRNRFDVVARENALQDNCVYGERERERESKREKEDAFVCVYRANSERSFVEARPTIALSVARSHHLT
ncbi:hypothetical protein DBV15_03649 [Temnothorax longispinosus]|uniref:Uncharacterized protein n=1 Tax=Temnothorax longispinosus TaxID=300112 RepID=A0A4S2KAZ4_9HYME|nr:hypothetical protein DBV15_03649 [Temnothorax longispinosus]